MAIAGRFHRLAGVLIGAMVLVGCSGGMATAIPASGLGPGPDGGSTSAPAVSAGRAPGDRVQGTLPVVITHGPAGRHRIALTFDSNMTDAMLNRLDTGQVSSYANTAVVDELTARHVPATF